MKASANKDSKGFALIAALLLLVLMSTLAIGMLMMVNTETAVGGHDLNQSKAYRSAEGAIEKMTSDLANTFAAIQAPAAADLCNLSKNPPTNDPGVSFPVYQVLPSPGDCVNLSTTYGPITQGPNAGLYAQIIPITLNVTAQRGISNGASIVGFGDEVSMTRQVEVALIPVFQFGVFSDSDLAFFTSPNLTFAGRVHTNGDLYLGVSNSATLTFEDKITAYGNVIRKVLPNGLDATAPSANDSGTVDILTTSQGCPGGLPGCRAMAQSEGSVDNPTAAQNPSWPAISHNSYQNWIIDGNYGQPGGTGATRLALSFVNPGGASTAQSNVQIIRRPPAGEATTSALGQARLANEAEIRILLSDNENDLHLPGWNGDVTQDVQLGACPAAGQQYPPSITVNGTANYFAWANIDPAKLNPDGVTGPDWQPAATDGIPVGSLPNGFFVPPTAPPCPGFTMQWPLIPGWLLVEVKETDGAYHGATNEWLSLGFARGLAVPNKETGVTNPLSNHQNAILYLQMLADRNGDGAITTPNSSQGTAYLASNSVEAANSAIKGAGGTRFAVTGVTTPVYENPYEGSPFNWYPINFYDAREGENWDAAQTKNTCTPNGVMNAVELDVGNLRSWLLNSATGKLIDFKTDNGYILYFSDRRGMQPPAPGQPLVGEYGFEDTINLATSGKPDGKLEPAMPTPAGKTPANTSPEDVNGNGVLDTYGVAHVGDAFGAWGNGANQTYAYDTNNEVPPTPYALGHRMTCYLQGRENAVTGARHVLKLVDGGMFNNGGVYTSYVPTKPDGSGGFTVGSENPVYIQGDYNTSASDPNWASPPNLNPDPTTHAAAAVIADAVTLLSNNWQDHGWYTTDYRSGTGGIAKPGSMNISAYTALGSGGDKPATTTYYRVAIAAGKTIPFNNTSATPTQYFGTEGGVSNFLRFLEDWTGQKVYYKGSLVSLYPSMYATGTFKCCTLVYNAPGRNFYFDPLFADPANMPPGTPVFRDVDNLSYRQNYTPRTN